MTRSNQYLKPFRRGAIAAILATTAIASACDYNEPVAEEPVAEEPVAEEPLAEEPAEVAEEYNVELGELTGNVEDYIGQAVSVRGEAEAAVGENAFLLQDDQLFGGQEVIVFNATGSPFLLPTNDEPTEDVQVTGEVRQLVLTELETEYGLDLDPELYTEYEDRPAIIAESIAFSPDAEEVTEEPEQYYGQRIAVAGEIGELLSTNTFQLQEEGWFENDEVLVIGTSLLPTVDEAEEVVVTGTLRPYVAAEFEQEYDLDWDLDLQEQIEAEYTERPVLVADEVYLGAQ